MSLFHWEMFQPQQAKNRFCQVDVVLRKFQVHTRPFLTSRCCLCNVLVLTGSFLTLRRLSDRFQLWQDHSWHYVVCHYVVCIKCIKFQPEQDSSPRKISLDMTLFVWARFQSWQDHSCCWGLSRVSVILVTGPFSNMTLFCLSEKRFAWALQSWGLFSSL